MLPEARDRMALEAIVVQCGKIQRYRESYGDGLEAFAANEDFRDLCALAIIQIGEATNHLSEGFRATHPAIDWRALYGMRCMLTHDYIKVDNRVFWQTLEEDIPSLQAFCKSLL